jgi:hypothetical protein
VILKGRDSSLSARIRRSGRRRSRPRHRTATSTATRPWQI